jgi:hypothetical protein
VSSEIKRAMGLTAERFPAEHRGSWRNSGRQPIEPHDFSPRQPIGEACVIAAGRSNYSRQSERQFAAHLARRLRKVFRIPWCDDADHGTQPKLGLSAAPGPGAAAHASEGRLVRGMRSSTSKPRQRPPQAQHRPERVGPAHLKSQGVSRQSAYPTPEAVVPPPHRSAGKHLSR